MEWRWSWAHAHASWHASINASPVDAHLDDLVCLLNSLRANDNGAASSLTLVCQLRSVDLLFGAHQLSHGNLTLADSVIITAAIAVNEYKLVFLHLFKEVGQGESLLEVWIQSILYLLSFANLLPIVVTLFEKQALGVGLAECVQVSQLAAGYIQVDLHLQTIYSSSLYHRL